MTRKKKSGHKSHDHVSISQASNNRSSDSSRKGRSKRSRHSTSSSDDTASTKASSRSNSRKSSSSHKSKHYKSSKKSVYSVNKSPTSESISEQKFEQMKESLNKMDAKFRKQLEHESKKYEQMEAEEVQKFKQKRTGKLQHKAKKIQEVYRQNIEALATEFSDKQVKQLESLKENEVKFNQALEKKRKGWENEVQERVQSTDDDIEAYKVQRQSELEEQIKRLQEQCESDIKEYTKSRMRTNKELIDQIRQKLDLEISNELQKAKLDFTIKNDKVKESSQAAQAAEITRLNDEMAEAIAKLKSKDEANNDQKVQEIKRKIQKECENNKAKIEEEYKAERARLEKQILAYGDAMNDRMKQEQREIERRTRMKRHLLQMMSMKDLLKITDEEFLWNRYRYTIQRNNIVLHSNCSTIYEATLQDEDQVDCLCKVTMFNKWSARHKADFFKFGPRLARYASQFSTKISFVKVYNVLATDAKLYTFMEPLESSKTLDNYLLKKGSKSVGSFASPFTPTSATSSTSSGVGMPSSDKVVVLKRVEIVNIISQLVEALKFLSNLFVAHMGLTGENLTLIVPESSRLADSQVVLTGLTRSIVYYNVESDQYSPSKGYDSNELGQEHLPAECFENEFLASCCDVYGVGHLIYYMVKVRSPFCNCNYGNKMVDAKQSGAIKMEGVDSTLQNLVYSLTSVDPKRRTPLDNILNHSYFSNHQS